MDNSKIIDSGQRAQAAEDRGLRLTGIWIAGGEKGTLTRWYEYKTVQHCGKLELPPKSESRTIILGCSPPICVRAHVRAHVHMHTPKGNKAVFQRNVCTPTFIPALFVLAKKCKDAPVFPSCSVSKENMACVHSGTLALMRMKSLHL